MVEPLRIRYKNHIRRRFLILSGLAAAACLAVIVSLQIGAYSIGAKDILHVLMNHSDASVKHILMNIRLPRTLAAILAGGSLGLAGVVMQNVLKNPLASPFTLGISQGAAFGAAAAMIVLGSSTLSGAGNALAMPPSYAVVSSAFLGSLLTVFALLLLSAWRDLTPAALILTGIALNSFFGAARMLLQYFASDIEVAAAVFWTFGDLGRAGWSDLLIILIALIPASLYLMKQRWQFNALLWGDDAAKSLGVNVFRLRLIALALAALVAALITAFLGIIGFVGLIAPHMMRMMLGQDHRFLLPCSIIAGALLLLISDILARTVMAPVILPVGILTSFAGVPLFLYLLVRRGGIRA